ncbi:glycoside hydrolase family 31 protein [Demequina sp. SYSU T00192]|uniref:Glycoside hydrolase family 31 protein n=1 Tax=Demequina litoralis TaxID=3051660 RepID=A0ABT8G6L1_9MICO|nr:TIM-barrel domain-containing protein [Demequina sp. SYSU T00192]MDN4474776.1 glycoside hydrolase family 31 protein [Demequina sp. SYSU T00192]
MPTIHQSATGLDIISENEHLRVEAWGRHAIRVRASRRPIDHLSSAAEEVQALLPAEAAAPVVEVGDGVARVVNGDIAAEVRVEGHAETGTVKLRFVRTTDGVEVLREQPAHFWHPGARLLEDDGAGAGRIEQRFAAREDERLYGLGQHTHGRLDQKGLVIDLVQRNAEVSVPFMLSSAGYGFLWNNPAIGRVELAENGTRWVADSARAIDYWVTAAEDPATILTRYADATGRPPALPRWATGFWQSKLRYQSQEELLEVAREHRRRGLPLSVIVLDYFSWTRLGDWRLDTEEWPDLEGALAELHEMGVRLMVSIWPSVNPSSENMDDLRDGNMLMSRASGLPFTATWTDKGADHAEPVAFYDPTNPAARRFIWDTVKRNYFDAGVRIWWLDACEPEIRPADHRQLHFWAGPGAEIANVYPREHARAFAEGMRGAGDDDVVLLCRSAWAGSQRYGAAVWSGDIGVTWESLAAQVRAGLNMSLSGIPWWTTDIGGFHGGVPEDPGYRELVVRWFQWAVFLPLFRLHGFREPRTALGASQTGGPNEVWSYGEEAYGLISRSLDLRESIRPYLDALMDEAAASGLPPMRTLFVEFPDDEAAWGIDDAYMLGSHVLVAPVTAPGATSRQVYLPAGTSWTEAETGAAHEGGTWVEAAAPSHAIPVFVSAGAPDTAVVLLSAGDAR